MDLKERLAVLKERIDGAVKRAKRDQGVRVIAVTKTHPKEIIQKLYNAGITDIGENYVQEMLSKWEVGLPLNWHFIGTLQKNKVKYLVGRVFLIHSVDSLALSAEIDKRSKAVGIVQPVLVQVNQGEETKGGVKIKDLPSFMEELNNFHNLQVKGLMAMPPFFEDVEKTRGYFKEVRELMELINRKGCYREPLTELSMGMSSDFEVAIEEGSTMVRIGTALLGGRR